jgi:hypothetical protein
MGKESRKREQKGKYDKRGMREKAKHRKRWGSRRVNECEEARAAAGGASKLIRFPSLSPFFLSLEAGGCEEKSERSERKREAARMSEK